MRKASFFIVSIFLAVLSFTAMVLLMPSRQTDAQDQPLICEMWHLDTFEGGTGSRASFLARKAREYEKISGNKIEVKFQTVYSAEINFSKGIYPHIISYGNGIKLPYELLQPINATNCQDLGCEYASVWCVGGYVLINKKGRSTEKILVSSQENTLPLLALYTSGNITAANDIKFVPSNLAVAEFLSSKDCALLGTQRDLYRLKDNTEIEVKPLCGFNDLYQYVSILTDGVCAKIAREFIDFLTSEKSFGELDRIGMLSPLGGEYSPPLSPLSHSNIQYKTEVFITKSGIVRLKELALNFELNSESIKSSLKRLK